jgi:DNA-binding transcriptional regulator LsrR (DeoR family)
MSSLAQQLGLSESQVEHLINDHLNEHIIDIFAYGLYTMLFGSTIRQIGDHFVLVCSSDFHD